jgi:3-deoxy-manno-octulosonate cytidylyltransferase (CMP-KDO synthetase)
MPDDRSMVTVVIPARFASSRFPGKPLASLAGKPLIQHVYERVQGCAAVQRIVVATDDARVAEAVQRFGGDCLVTTESYRTGTDRVAGVARHMTGDLFINVQGDEVILDPALLTELIAGFRSCRAEIGTVKRALSAGEIENPAVVKVVTNDSGEALYFSRAIIPYVRDPDSAGSTATRYFMHLGMYIFTRASLERFAALPTGRLEHLEKLEQLRALEHGMPIRVWETQHRSLRVDTPEDAAEAERELERCVPCR